MSHSKPKLGEPFNPYRMFTGVFVPEPIVRCPDLTPGSKLAYGRLVRYAGDDGHCYPSLATLGRELGTSRDQAKRYVRELAAGGLIRVIPRKTEAGDPDASEVLFLWHVLFDAEGVGASMPLPGRGTDAPTVDASMPRGVGASMPPKENHIKRVIEDKKTSAAKGAADSLTAARFDEFWNLYWRKVGKMAARKVFDRKITTEAKWLRVKGAVLAQKDEMLTREERYRPHAATWLAQERWTDEPAPQPEPERLNVYRPPTRGDRFEARDERAAQTAAALITERMARR